MRVLLGLRDYYGNMLMLFYLFSFSSHHYSCLHICWYKEVIITGYSNGVMRIFNVKLNKLVIEVSAHSRLISGLAIAPESGLASAMGCG